MYIKNILLHLLLAISISACGGGGGSSSSSSNINDDSSGDSSTTYSALFEQAYSILNENNEPGETHSVSISDTGDGYGVGCSEENSMTRDELESFVQEELEFSLCGEQTNDASNPLCLYPGEDAFRTVEVASDQTYEGAEQEIINIPLENGEVEFSLTSYEADFDYEFEAQNNAEGCDSDTLYEKITFAGTDIIGEYVVNVVRINENGVPVTDTTGDLTCVEGVCTGDIEITDLVYDSFTESWTGLLTFNDSKYDLVATLSPDKSVAAIAGLPLLTGEKPQEFSEACLFIGAKRK